MADFKDLYAYKKGFELSMEIFEITKKFPPEEKYALTDQIRRSSRSVCANIAEAFRKRRYPNHFISKLTDSDAENSETQVWLEFALSCKYIDQNTFDYLTQKAIEVGKLLSNMIKHPNNYLDKIKLKMD